jgi:hypothetical protein
VYVVKEAFGLGMVDSLMTLDGSLLRDDCMRFVGMEKGRVEGEEVFYTALVEDYEYTRYRENAPYL